MGLRVKEIFGMRWGTFLGIKKKLFSIHFWANFVYIYRGRLPFLSWIKVGAGLNSLLTVTRLLVRSILLRLPFYSTVDVTMFE